MKPNLKSVLRSFQKRIHALCAGSAAVLFLQLTGCDSGPILLPESNPTRLSEWNLFTIDEQFFEPNEETQVIYPTNSLFTDYAHKLRTIWVPPKTQITWDNENLLYPVGTILSKTFYYPKSASGELLKTTDPQNTTIALYESKLIETRLLVRRNDGWDAIPYVWNEDQTEAFLRIAGSSHEITLTSINGAKNKDQEPPQKFTYFSPNENQCAGCHTTDHPDGGLLPLGAVASQLNTTVLDQTDSNSESQLDRLVTKGWLTHSERNKFSRYTKSYNDQSATLEERALAYLNMNCSHCHNPLGPADTSGLILTGNHRSPINLGICKPPVAAGRGAGNLRYGIEPGSQEKSILVYRMNSSESDEMMPELGRSLVHEEGLKLIRDWISSMPGQCG